MRNGKRNTKEKRIRSNSERTDNNIQDNNKTHRDIFIESISEKRGTEQINSSDRIQRRKKDREENTR